MFIAVSGTLSAGKSEVVRYLSFQGFTLVSINASQENGAVQNGHSAENGSNGTTKLKQASSDLGQMIFTSFDSLLDHVTENWRSNFVLSHIDDVEMLKALQKRPFFLHLSIDAPLNLRFQRHELKMGTQALSRSLFIEQSDDLLFNASNPLIEINNQAHIKVINTSTSLKDLYIKLSELDLLNQERLRPTWDAYFMRLADLAALRSNCMKRRVGCVIVKDNRVVATGYNGTPRHLTNCNEGGCPRCNKGQGSGAALSTCLCLHAEENALLEAGRDRIAGENSILYCNTCPCLTCSIKIVQSGIKQVVYAQSYSMDEHSHKVFNEARVVLRQYVPPKEGIFV